VLTEGFDAPEVSCIVLARPTKQLGLFRQMAGRGLRPSPGKENLKLIDHSSAVFRHGLLEDRIEWTLDTDKRANNAIHAKRDIGAIGRLIECSQCGAMRTAGEKCPSCGFLPQRRPEAIVFPDTGPRAIVRILSVEERAKIEARATALEAALEPFTRNDEHAVRASINGLFSGYRAMRQMGEAARAVALDRRVPSSGLRTTCSRPSPSLASSN
jgi:superfamily II DNA or RNA helicase